MDAIEKRAVIVLADISGYTRFMVENQMSAVHGQQCITFLIETLIREIDIPLRLQEIEGDALFLYAEDPGNDDGWEQVLQQVAEKLPRFFKAFYEGIVLGMEATPCKCAICRNSKELALKIVVHSGTAVFHEIGGFKKVSGPDVILAHRLLKNSVPAKEYLLMSDAGHSTVGCQMAGEFIQGMETYDGFGAVTTFVRYNDDMKEEHLDALYKLSPAKLTARAELYSVAAMIGAFPALIRQLRAPAIASSRMSWSWFALLFVLRAPLMALTYMISAPRRLLSQRNRHKEKLLNKKTPT